MPAYPTPHIKAVPGDFAKTVLMPGDPLRSRFIAETFLQDAVLVNDVRGIQGYTGFWKGHRVSVMASGMGMPSMGIYSYELYTVFGVENIIRIGSAGGMSESLQLRDIVLGMGASTDSNYAGQFGLNGQLAPLADYTLLSTAERICREKGLRHQVGNLFSSDTFYNADPDVNRKWADLGVLAVEMESAALYWNAARCGKRALTICTISDHVFRGESLSSDERQTSFTEMMEVALDTAAELDR